ncbi:MAG: hypothetical protein M1838_001246 [Thelocarpon superellum]|nr:MAG: hypothetical protein M1838_001246 [Thelocarpon superellum]
MALTSWKSFNFFDVSQVKPPDEGESSRVFGNSDISCVCSGSDNLFLGSTDGFVRILSRTFKVVRAFQAHETASITHMKQVEGTSLLVTISEDLSNEPVLRISAFAALDDLSQLAVGFANGSVTVIRGDLIHDRGAKQRTVFESEEPVTGVAFREGTRLTTLYLSTTARILTLVISGKGQGQPARSLEDAGCGVDCMTVDQRTGDIIVVRDDAIYYYGLNGRGPCYAYEGPKRLVDTYKEYVALISPPKSRSTSANTAMGRFSNGSADDLFNTTTFTLLDTDLKYVAHSEGLIAQVKTLFVEWGDLFILTVDGKLFRYHEKTLPQKLEILYQRNLYVLAISLAQKANLGVVQQNIIYRRYGDYLYQKAEFDGAMQQYLKAINNTEPSQVIRKFLDAQRTQNLIEYLEELHEHHKANADHTTLLLNCYAKLKDIDKLEKFIKSPGELKFDLDTAISMCRQGGYFAQAAYLATRHGEHDLVVTILVEDSKKYAEALQYIWRLDPATAYHNLMKYARVLLEHCSVDTRQLFIDYYTGRYQPRRDPVPPADSSASAGGASSAIQSLASFLPLSYLNPSNLASNLTSNLASPGPEAQKVPVAPSAAADGATPHESVSYEVPKPRTAFSAFVDHPDDFIAFLESCLGEGGVEEENQGDLYTTLFEMYLHKASEKRGDERAGWEARAKHLIESGEIPIDTSNVLLLSHLSNFRDGTILVREKQGLRFDIFRSYTSANDTAGAIKALKKYGPEEPHLYPAALAYFTSSATVLEEAGDELEVVLKKIEDDGLMAPLQVIQTLSASGVATMGLLKKYLSATVERESKEIAYNRRLIESYRSETEVKRKEIDELGSKPAVFQARRCSACGGNLDLPTVHFLCKHSFHQRCLNQVDDDIACPLCAAENSTIRAIRRAQEESADRHDMFQDALERSTDRFGTISEFFGRGVMSVPTNE